MGSAAETRRRLLEQARIAFAAKGHDGVSVQKDILEPTGISTGSFYHQFRDKTDLLVALLEQSNKALADSARATLPDPSSGDVLARATARYDRWFALIESHEDLFRIEMSARTIDDDRVQALLAQLQELWTETVTAAIDTARAEATRAVDPAIVSELVITMARGVIHQYLDTPPSARRKKRKLLSEPLARFTIGGLVGLVDPPD